jgi:hypothetical protein
VRAQGERHGPIWYLTVTLGRGRTTGGIIPDEKVAEVRGWIGNYHKLKDQLERSPKSTANCCGASAPNSANTSQKDKGVHGAGRQARIAFGSYISVLPRLA